MVRRFTVLLVPVAAMVACTSPAAGQQRVTGVVTDSASGAGIVGALVRLGSVEEESDTAGAFTIAARLAADTLVIHRIGYSDARLPVAALSGPVRVRLRPDPRMLQALRVVTRPGVCSHCGRDPMLGDVARYVFPGSTLLDLLEDRFGYRRVPCERPPGDGQAGVYCSLVRGRAQPISLYVDGVRAAGGLDDVQLYSIPSIYAVAVSRDRRAVSLITNRQAEAAARAYLDNNGALR